MDDSSSIIKSGSSDIVGQSRSVGDLLPVDNSTESTAITPEQLQSIRNGLSTTIVLTEQIVQVLSKSNDLLSKDIKKVRNLKRRVRRQIPTIPIGGLSNFAADLLKKPASAAKGAVTPLAGALGLEAVANLLDDGDIGDTITDTTQDFKTHQIDLVRRKTKGLGIGKRFKKWWKKRFNKNNKINKKNINNKKKINKKNINNKKKIKVDNNNNKKKIKVDNNNKKKIKVDNNNKKNIKINQNQKRNLLKSSLKFLTKNSGLAMIVGDLAFPQGFNEYDAIKGPNAKFNEPGISGEEVHFWLKSFTKHLPNGIPDPKILKEEWGITDEALGKYLEYLETIKGQQSNIKGVERSNETSSLNKDTSIQKKVIVVATN